MAEKIALLDTINPAAQAAFQQAGLDIITFPRPKDADELTEAVGGARIVGVRSGGVPDGFIEANPQVDAIGCFCVGVKVDRQAAKQEGVAIFNAADENT